jgi:hypothetical protein
MCQANKGGNCIVSILQDPWSEGFGWLEDFQSRLCQCYAGYALTVLQVTPSTNHKKVNIEQLTIQCCHHCGA